MDLSEKQQELDELKEKLEAFRAKYLQGDAEKAIESPPPPFLASCPSCSSKMEAGHVEIHGTFLGFLLVGFSYQHCWFVSVDRNEEIALGTDDKRNACRCTDCGTLVIAGGKAQLR